MKKAWLIRLLCGLSAAAFVATGTMMNGMNTYAKEDTVYSIGSVSKMYVSAAVMQLVDQGKINLDEPVVTYIPEFQMADERYKLITVRMLLNHTSGIMGTVYADAFQYEDNDPVYHDQQLLENLKKQRLKANPGEFSTYCNDGFDLLEIVVERVSGEDFTDYMTNHIVKPIGGSLTGSYKNMFQSEHQVDIYNAEGRTFAHEYHIGIGTGGVLSTAGELCKFGGTFFKGDNTLLSENAKKLMEEDLSANPYEGHYALGWDDVDVYEGTGIKVVTKGGDLMNQHASLLVAPEEKISVAVCSAGGNSSVDQMMAKSIMNVVLEEMGKEVKEPEKKEFVTTDQVPEDYLSQEGYYYTGSGVYHVTFPEGKYMKLELCDEERKTKLYYKYVGNGQFAKMLGDVSKGSDAVDADYQLISFTTRENGRSYMVDESKMEFPKMGMYYGASYYAEKMEEGTADAAAQKAWEDRAGKYYLTNGKYSNCAYMGMQVVEIKTSESCPGYVYTMGMQKIVSDKQAQAFVNLPGQGGRDLKDVTVTKVKSMDASGKVADMEGIVFDGMGLSYVREGNMPVFTAEVNQVEFADCKTKWYIIDEQLGGQVISLSRSEKTAVYVYDEFDHCIYNTYTGGFDNRVSLPKEGKILFLGEKGEKVEIVK